MHIEIRALDRLRGRNAVDLGPTLTAIGKAARTSTLDLARLRVVCDWVQYRENFREVVSLREIVPNAVEAARAVAGGRNALAALSRENQAFELGIDLRRAATTDLEAVLAQVLSPSEEEAKPEECRQYLEDWVPEASSCIWSFNSLYWNALGLWEQATGREYEQALPSGESDALNTAAAREIILQLFHVWDNLAARRALPEDLHVLELGVGNGNQARVWLDEFARLDQERNGEYYRRLHYLMGDYSPHVLERARANVSAHATHVSSLVLDARSPSETLGFLRSKAFLIYISNVYDNLPTDEIVRIGGQVFRVLVRAYLPPENAEKIATELKMKAEEVPGLVGRLLHLGPELLSHALPELFPDGPMGAVAFWRQAWEAVSMEERYVPIEGLDTYEIAHGVSAEILRPIVEAGGDVRMQLSNGAAASFVDSLPLLHPFGMLLCHDLFVTEQRQYETGFRGPGKYDGSVVNWVNGLVLSAIARRRGYEIGFQPFSHRAGSNITTLSARIQE